MSDEPDFSHLDHIQPHVFDPKWDEHQLRAVCECFRLQCNRLMMHQFKQIRKSYEFTLEWMIPVPAVLLNKTLIKTNGMQYVRWIQEVFTTSKSFVFSFTVTHRDIRFSRHSTSAKKHFAFQMHSVGWTSTARKTKNVWRTDAEYRQLVFAA